MSNLQFIKTAVCSLLLLAATGISAQIAPKPEVLDKEDKPKLDKAVLGGGEYGSGRVVDISVNAVEDDIPLSETEVKGRSEADGKMSKVERALLARARRQPQTE